MLEIDPGQMVWTLITFVIAVAVLWKFAFGPLQRVIDGRSAQIRESIETAEATRAEAARLLDEYQGTLAEVRAEAETILERSRKAGETTKAEIVDEARRQAERTLEKAHQQIERDVRAALNELKKQVADLTVLATERVITKTLTEDDQRRLLEEALAGIDMDDLDPRGAG